MRPTFAWVRTWLSARWEFKQQMLGISSNGSQKPLSCVPPGGVGMNSDLSCDLRQCEPAATLQVLAVAFNAVGKAEMLDSGSCEGISCARAIAVGVQGARNLVVRLFSRKDADLINDCGGRADKFEIGAGPWQLERSGCPAFPANLHVDQVLVPRQRHVVDQKPQRALAITR